MESNRDINPILSEALKCYEIIEDQEKKLISLGYNVRVFVEEIFS